MKERPILFSGPMVRAILEGRKTMTRRVVKPNLFIERNGGNLPPIEQSHAYFGVFCSRHVSCPYGQPGDRLWVRETWARGMTDEELYYRATDKEITDEEREEGMRWKPSIHMPRWASRITLEVTEVRVERLQGITEADSVAEGIKPLQGGAVSDFRLLWDHLNASRGYGWDANPWVWVVSFRRVR